MKKIKLNKIILLIFGIILAGTILSFGKAKNEKTEEPKNGKTEELIRRLTDVKTEEPNNMETEKSNPNSNSQFSPSPISTLTSQISSTPTPQITESPKPVVDNRQLITLSIQSVGEYSIKYNDNDTAWDIMQRATQEYNFNMTYQVFDFGIYIISINNIKPNNNSYWALYYNNQYSQVGVKDLIVKPNDTIKWQIESW